MGQFHFTTGKLPPDSTILVRSVVGLNRWGVGLDEGRCCTAEIFTPQIQNGRGLAGNSWSVPNAQPATEQLYDTSTGDQVPRLS